MKFLGDKKRVLADGGFRCMKLKKKRKKEKGWRALSSLLGLAPLDQLFDLLATLVSDLFVELVAVPLLGHVSAAAARFLHTDVAF